MYNLNLVNHTNNKEWEQFEKRFSFHNEGIQLKNNEVTIDFLDSVKNTFELAEVNVPDMV